MNDNYNYSAFNAQSRALIYTRIMKLSEGQDWKFDYDAFVKWDKAHPTSSVSVTKSNSGEFDDDFEEDHVPP